MLLLDAVQPLWRFPGQKLMLAKNNNANISGVYSHPGQAGKALRV
jgi:hypothetical protein